MKRILTIITAISVAIPAATSAVKTIDSSFIKLHDLSVNIDEQQGKMRIAIDVDPKEYKVKSEREIILTPILVAENRSDSLLLSEIVIAGRNRWLQYQRQNLLDDGEAGIYRAGKKAHARVYEEIPLEKWMYDSSLEFRVMTANCCDSPELLAGTSPSGNVPLANIDMERPQLKTEYKSTPPVDAGPVIKHIEGSAFVTFQINNTVLKENYMKNRTELNKIIKSIEFVRNDSDARITSVHIKGFASPDGPYENNVRLAQGRTEALRQYVRDLYSFSDSIVTSSYVAEDWNGLRSYVADSLNFNITDRKAILEIIDGPLEYDQKNDAIMRRFPKDYAVMLKQIYPWLRRTDYNVTYEIKEYTNIAEIKRVYQTDPSRLRNIDFFTLAETYPKGSQEYCDVYTTALRIYPNDPELNINAAYMEMERGNLDKAQVYLYQAGDVPEASYGLGILAAKRGDYKDAIDQLKAARDAGVAGVDKTIERVNAISKHTPVTYLIEPTETLAIK